MKKKVTGIKLSRGQGARKALFRSLIKALVLNGKIVTTKAKAKTISRLIDKLVNFSKTKSVSGKRRLYKLLGNDRNTSEKLAKEIAPLFSDRRGGYTRVINLPQRRGDSARMARLEWVKEVVQEKEQVQGKSITKKSKSKDEPTLKAGSSNRGLLKRFKKAK
jgi:large subunit ribosomal protein L17